MKKFYTSDTHYGHRNVIRYCNRPFETSEEMDEAMIDRWNDIVGPNDEVYHLGDFSMGKTAVPNIVRRLNGKIHLIWGNHDSNQVRNLDCWASSQPYLEIKDQGKHIVLCHYKFHVFNRSHHGAIQLFGHSHGSMPGNSQQIDVGVDCWDFRPILLEQALEGMSKLPPYQSDDHHKE